MTADRPYPLTPAQRAAAWVIAEFQATLGTGPTLAELANEMDFGKGNACRLVAGLIERGWMAPRLKNTRAPFQIKPEALPLLASSALFEHEIEITDLGRREIAVRSVS